MSRDGGPFYVRPGQQLTITIEGPDGARVLVRGVLRMVPAHGRGMAVETLLVAADQVRQLPPRTARRGA